VTDSTSDKSKVPSRLRWIERQRALLSQQEADAQDLGDLQGGGLENRHGKPQIPVGQNIVEKWPVLDLGHQPEITPEHWELELAGECENPQVLSWQDLMDLPQVEEASDFHCVTTWSLLDSVWRGVRFQEIAALAAPTASVEHVLVTGYDQDPMSGIPYTTNLRLADAVAPDVLLVHQWQGEALPRKHGGPVRMITPRLYAWKGAKWVRKIEFLTREELGFWEKRGYSNSAKPWSNDRFSG
jgi:DMSO/TMAO reductase YedYZ molybdopterin-dependent catalytic subunit